MSDVRWILTEWLDAVARRWRLWRSSEEQSQVALRSSAMEEAMRFLTENNESATPPFDIPETVAAYAAWTDRFIKIALPVAFCTNCCALGSRRLAVTVSRYVFFSLFFELLANFLQPLRGSFSAVSKRNFASKYSFESS